MFGAVRDRGTRVVFGRRQLLLLPASAISRASAVMFMLDFAGM